MSTPKSEWPELVGKTGEEAKAQILKERTDVTVKIQDELGPATLDYSPNRVRIFVNKDGIVAAAPRTG